MVFFTFSWGIVICMLFILIIVSCAIFNINLFKAVNGIFDLFVLQLDFRAQICLIFFSVYILYILFSNLLGLISGGQTITAQLFHNIPLSFVLIVGLMIIGLVKYDYEFFSLFMPSNVSRLIFSFIALLEIVPFLIRIVSLTLRLFANMVAGHACLHVLFRFLGLGVIIFSLSLFMLNKSIMVMLPAYLIVIIITFFEMLVAAIQAYVFGLLFLVYIKDFYPPFMEELTIRLQEQVWLYILLWYFKYWLYSINFLITLGQPKG